MIAPGIGPLRVSRIQHRTLQLWGNGLLEHGVSVSSASSSLSIVKNALGELVRLGVLTSNPTTRVRVGKAPRGREDTWTADEVRGALESVRGEARLGALYVLALTTGMRPGELQGPQVAGRRS